MAGPNLYVLWSMHGRNWAQLSRRIQKFLEVFNIGIKSKLQNILFIKVLKKNSHDISDPAWIYACYLFVLKH